MQILELRSTVSAFALVPTLLGLAGAAHAGSDFLVSTTAGVSPANGPDIDDSSLARVGDGAAALAFSEGHWLALVGFVPGDVDALALRPGFPAGHHQSYAFSFLSNEGAFLDGDVLSFAPGGGFEVIVSEGQLAAALGTPDAALDVDALTYDDAGRLCFSIQSDLAATVLGDVEDGDVLRLENDGTAAMVLSEVDVQSAFTLATGSSDAIGDVLGATYVGSELWVSTQGPSSSDGALLSTGATPAIEQDEVAMGLGGAELSALAFSPSSDDAGRMWMSATSAQKGDVLTATYSGGTPFGLVAVLPAGNVGYSVLDGFAGIGAWFFDLADPTLNQTLGGAIPVMALDDTGSLTTPFPVPMVSSGGLGWTGDSGWSFHCVELSTETIVTPYRMQVTN